MKKTITGLLLLLGIISISSFRETPPAFEKENFKNEFLKLINQTRTKGCNCGSKFYHGASPLVWNDKLATAAQGHADDMAAKQYFNHTSEDGRSMSDRIISAGYLFKGFKSFAVGENIAFGQNSIKEVMAGWFKSEGHCQNLMNPQFKEVGVAENNKYWVQDFGGREAFSAEQQRLIRTGKYRLIQKESDKH